MTEPRIRRAFAPQLKLSRNELGRLADRVEEDYQSAVSDHDRRMERFRGYLRRWRDLKDEPVAGEEDAPDFRIPLTIWQVFGKWSKQFMALFGDDAEIIAEPTGPSDQRVVRKIGRYMHWRLFKSMRIRRKAATFIFRQILFGRAHAYGPWLRETFFAPTEDGGEVELIDFEGPGFEPLAPDDLVVPGEDAQTIHDFSFVIRKYQEPLDDLLRGEGTLYQGIGEIWDDLVTLAEQAPGRDTPGDELKRDLDLAEGVNRESNLSARGSARVWEWCGKWRMLKRGAGDGRAGNYDRRQRFQRELLVRYQPDLKRTIGVQDLAQMYPLMAKRRPILEGALVADGSYWPPGFGELLERLEKQASAAHNMGSEAGMFSVGPVILYRPAEGFDPEELTYEPKTAIPTADPAGVRVLEVRANLEYPVLEERACLGYGERVTNVTDMSLGRTPEQPNAPRTARQTLALLEEGDYRVGLDTSLLKEDWASIASHVWLLDSMYAPQSLFFRVTEEDAGGWFETANGGAKMTQAERGGRYDFDIRFATSYFQKEARRDRQLALYQLDLQNPLVAQNARALWQITQRVHQAFGDDRFADLVPEPPDLGLPRNPREEWTMCLQGEDVAVHPEDNDELHLLDHNKRLREARVDPQRDEDAYHRLTRHCLDHIAQLQQKRLMAGLAERLAETVKGAGQMAPEQLLGMLGMPPGGGGQAPPGAEGQM
ncbi:MAG: hypothetical protein FJW34_00110 [Acidobacteria bacterium]|nr:hypothetical protein [Acidobacteriota bacterium]